MKVKLLNSLKTKLFFTLVIVTSTVIISLSSFINKDFEENRFKLFKDEIISHGKLVEANLAENIYHRNLFSIEKKLHAILNTEAIKYIVIKSITKQIYYKENFKEAIIYDFTKSNFEKITPQDNIVKFRKNIEFKDKSVATLFFGYDLNHFRNNVEELKAAYNKKLVYSLFFNAILMYLIVVVYYSPIKNIIKKLKSIRGGNLLSKLEVKRNDEIGYIYSTFDILIDRIFELKKTKTSFSENLSQVEKEEESKLPAVVEEFKGIYDNVTTGIYRMYPNGEYKLANPAFLNMLGVSSLEEFIKYKDQIKGTINAAQRINFFKNVIQNGCAVGFEQVWNSKNGSKIYVRESVRAVKDKNGKVLFYDGTVEDITENKRIEKNLISSKEKSEREIRLKADILDLMSNQIKTPFDNIKSYTKILENEILKTDPKELKIDEEAFNKSRNNLISKIESILRIAQNQAGNTDAYKTKIDLVDDILTNVFNEFKEAAENKKIQFNLHNFAEHTKVLGDTYSINQLFINLIDNAIKFTEEGFININIYNDMNGILSVAIEDSGIGIDKKFLPNLFEPFFQGEKISNDKLNINGLGLALVKKYIELNDAIIQVKSIKGKGTKFIVKFVNTNKNHSSKVKQKVKTNNV